MKLIPFETIHEKVAELRSKGCIFASLSRVDAGDAENVLAKPTESTTFTFIQFKVANRSEKMQFCKLSPRT
ncbi:hypothetical protein PAJ34TS1_53530 [Paenibacillus azoreducens]|uniref:Uncharacterized protein n=1 Tax=Paenibacillus azoreducens TaxID=116718 RepID=A0A919YAD0_9BACL|nr:hypothetical protein J34TS1_08680 [Paenibacillus azoreducens]